MKPDTSILSKMSLNTNNRLTQRSYKSSEKKTKLDLEYLNMKLSDSKFGKHLIGPYTPSTKNPYRANDNFDFSI